MKPTASPLDILDFGITNFQFEFIPIDETKSGDVHQYFESYDLDIDFGVTSNEYIHVFVKADINRGKEKLPGYSIFAEAGCIFKFNENAKLSEEQKSSLHDFSTIYIALNSLRGLISFFTANAPYGRYILPSIDLNDLINQKKAVLRKLKESQSLGVASNKKQSIKKGGTKTKK